MFHNTHMQTDLIDEEADAIRAWIEMIVQDAGTTPSQLADERGFNPSTLTRFLGGKTRMLSTAILAKLATNSPVSVPITVQKKIDRTNKNTNEHRVVNMQSLIMDGRIPVWGVHPVRRDGEFKLNTIAVYFLERAGVANKSMRLAAIYAPDETMSPRWSAGEPVIFDLAKSGTTGGFAMIHLSAPEDSPNDTETWLFRKIEKRSGGFLHLIALGEGTEPVQIRLDRVLEVKHVLNWSEILG